MKVQANTDSGTPVIAGSAATSRGSRRPLGMLVAVLLAAVAAAAARPDSAAAFYTFSDRSFIGASIICRGAGAYSEQITFASSVNPYTTAFYRIWIYNHQTRRWEGPSPWVRTTTGMVTGGPAMFGRRGTFSFYADYAQAVNGRWEYGGEWVGSCYFS